MKKKKKPQKEEVKQLDLGIKEPFKNRFLKIKGQFKNKAIQFEVRKFLKDPFVWATITICLVLIGQQALLIYQNFESLPTYIPVFRYFLNPERKLVDTNYIITFPIISSTILILSLLVTSNYYNRERFLTKILLLTTVLATISQNVILIDLVKNF